MRIGLGMWNRWWPFARGTLAWIGAAFLLLVAALAVRLWLEFSEMDARNQASAADVARILAWTSQPGNGSGQVIGSFRSARSFTGDHFDAYCISLPEVTGGMGWRPAADLDASFRGAAAMALDSADQYLDCVPSSEEMDQGSVLVKVITVSFSGDNPYNVEVAYLSPEKKQVFYVSLKV